MNSFNWTLSIQLMKLLSIQRMKLFSNKLMKLLSNQRMKLLSNQCMELQRIGLKTILSSLLADPTSHQSQYIKLFIMY